MNNKKFKTVTIQTGHATTSRFQFNIPAVCPYCGDAVTSQYKHNAIELNNSKQIVILIISVPCCEKKYFTVYLSDKRFHSMQPTPYPFAELLYTYPEVKLKNFSDEIRKISPNFEKYYNQCYVADESNHLFTAGAGYRNSLQILITDFAINVLKNDSKKVNKKSLNNLIEDYLPDIKKSADVVRLLGNTFTHDFDNAAFDSREAVEHIKWYLDICINEIAKQYKMLNPPVVAPN